MAVCAQVGAFLKASQEGCTDQVKVTGACEHLTPIQGVSCISVSVVPVSLDFSTVSPLGRLYRK